jgi:predicted MPP superfamily phosphohydrolase
MIGSENKIIAPTQAIAVSESKSQAKLTIIQITDVYTLKNFASLKTMIQQKRLENPNQKVISMLTGDLCEPSRLSLS